MRPTKIILLAILLTQAACYSRERSDVCSPSPNVKGNFDLGVEDRGSFLLVSVRNKSNEDIYILEPPQYSNILSTVKTRKHSVVCLGENPARNRSVLVVAEGALDIRLEKKNAITEIQKIKSKRDFRFLYEGVYGGAYSGVCSMNAQSKIECQPSDTNAKNNTTPE